MQTLTLALVQGDTRWHDPAANREYYAELLQAAKGADLVILPETFMSGFTQDTRDSVETMEGPGITWLQAQAQALGAVVTGSLAIRAGATIYNRMLWVAPDGSLSYYDKRHLFRMAQEHRRYGSGSERPIFSLNGWRILPQVCYDLRFPVWLRNRRDARQVGGMEYDLLLFVANWPQERRGAWQTLLRARAIENLAYVAGVNRVGSDGNGFQYRGDSALIDPTGEALIELTGQAQVAWIRLDPAQLLAYRESFPAWMDADAFSLSLD